MQFCKTEDQVADIFTKALGWERFKKNNLGLGSYDNPHNHDRTPSMLGWLIHTNL